MAFNKWKVIWLLLIVGITIDWSTSGHSKVLYENIVTMTVDGFEAEKDWVIKFSKFRSKNWDSDLKKPYDESNTWIKWLRAENKKKREEILPDGVLKNITLNDKENTILSVKGKWSFPGFNWLALEPAKTRPAKDAIEDWLHLVANKKDNWRPRRQDYDSKYHPQFIWMTGKMKEAYVYVWGGNFKYQLDAHFQDYKGNDFVIPVSTLNYKGWRNLKIHMPRHIRQGRHSVPNTQPLKFLRFKVSANPYEDPSEFYMYMDYFHALTDTYEKSFFGEELQFVENYWGDGSTTSPTPPKNN